jgi:hypothetical protein
MNRIKFLVFAFLALALIGWSLRLAPSLGAERAAQDASYALAAAPAAVGLKLEARRSEIQAAVLRLTASNALTNLGPKGVKPEPPTIDRFNLVRSAATEGASEPLKSSLVIVVANEAGVWVGQGGKDPASAIEGFDAALVTSASAAGTVVSAFGVPHFFVAAPLLTSDRNEVRVVGTAAVGAPLLPDPKVLASIRSDLKLTALGLAQDGKLVAVDGDRPTAELMLKSFKAESTGPVIEGPVGSLGPVSLPMMSARTQVLGLRRPIGGTPWEVVASVSATDGLIALAGFQKFALLALVGLLLLSIAIAALLRNEEEGQAMVLPPPMPLPTVRAQIEAAPPVSVPDAPPETVPEASPDDFDFSAAPGVKPIESTANGMASSQPVAQAPAFVAPPLSVPAPLSEPSSDPFSNLAPAPSAPGSTSRALPQPSAPAFSGASSGFAGATVPLPGAAAFSAPTIPLPGASKPNPPASVPANPFEDEEGARTVAYPVYKPAVPGAPPPGMDPFSQAGLQAAEPPAHEPDSNDATRVATVPAELMKAARPPGVPERSAPTNKTASGVLPRASTGSGVVFDEERHFQEVFREFMATREQCGEPGDGLPFERFRAKLLKSKDELMARHKCKWVRFQVYVKDNKAALKATPVKEA